MTLTTSQIDDLRRLLDECSQEKWAVDRSLQVVCKPPKRDVADCNTNIDKKDEANAHLIAKSKNALPALLDAAEENARLKGALEKIELINLEMAKTDIRDAQHICRAALNPKPPEVK